MKNSKCPNCNNEFETALARTYPCIARDFWTLWTGKRGYEAPEKQIEKSALVECPQCHHQFPSEDVKFFGFLSHKALKILMIIYVSAFIVIAAYVLIKGK
jgi:endogenous inhibitor of DNA gyrase (YacG/DUF329 family)